MLNKIHLWSGMTLLVFLTMHLYNHVQALQGPQAHIAVMHSLRPLYQSVFFETALLAAVCVQIASGFYFVARKWGERSGFFQHAQALSGLVLAVYLLIHVTGVINSRVVNNVDTNFYYAAALIRAEPWLHLPFYGLGIISLFVHLACGLRWSLGGVTSNKVRNWMAIGVMFNGVVIAVLILLALSGAFYDITLPAGYAEMER